jgi:hypothetical protein
MIPSQINAIKIIKYIYSISYPSVLSKDISLAYPQTLIVSAFLKSTSDDDFSPPQQVFLGIRNVDLEHISTTLVLDSKKKGKYSAILVRVYFLLHHPHFFIFIHSCTSALNSNSKFPYIYIYRIHQNQLSSTPSAATLANTNSRSTSQALPSKTRP